MPQLDELYSLQQNNIFKALYNQCNLGGKRLKQVVEPDVLASHQDFMLAEMVNMTVDFQEEGLHKRVLALKVAKESQQEMARRIREKMQRELKLKEIEENKKRGEAVLQLDDILPENNSMQQIVGMSALLEENNLDGMAQMYGFDGDAD